MNRPDRIDTQPQIAGANAVDRALTVLEILGDAGRPVRLAEIARRAELPRSTAHRLLQVLLAHNMIASDQGTYSVGGRIHDWLQPESDLDARSLRAVAIPFLVDLHNRTRGAVYLGVLRRGQVWYLAKIFGHRVIRTPSRYADWAPAHCTAIGKVLLSAGSGAQPVDRAVRAGGRPSRTGSEMAALAEETMPTGPHGVVSSLGNYVPDIGCLALGVTDASGDTRAAIAVSDHVDRLNLISANHHLRHIGSACSLAVQRADLGRSRNSAGHASRPR
ncbi:IclR family transcriptional regulator [Nocardia sp. BMG51109]|uniref:IclR family transcriptional regulator n=1 Tax=Nocardia sp. BMG51109 TaxID=1056816 RepID=UPI0004644F8F|nr:helix-turn-helix domain-containing protein [Nocardia sp. BMG51109]